MKILIDADACPVKEQVIRLAKEYQIPVYLYLDTSHLFDDAYCQVITVSQGADSADFALVNAAAPGDIGVTQDYGLAAMLLSKGAVVLDQDGRQYTSENIDGLLLSRHTSRKLRRQRSVRLKGPKKRTKAQNAAFEQALLALILLRRDRLGG